MIKNTTLIKRYFIRRSNQYSKQQTTLQIPKLLS